MSKPIHCVLVGLANAGKSALYNQFLGKKQIVGNWSGITVGAASKDLTLNDVDFRLTDLPGVSSFSELNQATATIDERLTHQFVQQQPIDVIINVIDATQLHRQLQLTLELREKNIPVVVVVTKTDGPNAVQLDAQKLSKALGCPVVLNQSNGKSETSPDGRLQIISAVKAIKAQQPFVNLLGPSVEKGRYALLLHDKNSFNNQAEIKSLRHTFITDVVKKCRRHEARPIKIVDRFDKLALHPILGIPLFLGAMYLLFMFAINVGGAFIDFFDGSAGALFVDWPVYWLNQAEVPSIVVALFEGLGMGVQTVATFIPLLACMFIGLSILEQSGYLARAAFVVDGVMQKIGLPGKSFVPLIVGFGCNVPSIMSTRVLDNERERITTAMMAPFMSCGARLPVYALFAAVFFPESGQNIVFILYLVGIVAAVMTGLLLKYTLLPGNSSHSFFELPAYERPSIERIKERTFRRTRDFVLGAGKIIVVLVCILNVLSAVDFSGNWVDQDKERSIIGVTAKAITPVLAPMGVHEDNWQATVGLVTGLFAKEVLVATLDNLYTVPKLSDEIPDNLLVSFTNATLTIPENLLGIKVNDPIGITIEESSNLAEAAQLQDVNLSTYEKMQTLFNGQLGAFSYLLFILLYTPCAAVLGAMKQEFGLQWAVFSALWCLVLAYLTAVLCYQIGSFQTTMFTSGLWIAGVGLMFFLIYLSLKRFGGRIMSVPITLSY